MHICLCVCLSEHVTASMVRHVPIGSIFFIENPPLQCATFFVDLLFFPQKICTFSASLNKCNFWGTFWPELCVQECYSLSMSVCVSTSEHESASMEKHVHDIDWSWMRHFLNPTLSIVWWNSIPYRKLNYTKNFNNKGNLTSLSHFRIWFKMVYLVRD